MALLDTLWSLSSSSQFVLPISGFAFILLLLRNPFYRKSLLLALAFFITFLYSIPLCLVLAPLGRRASLNYYACKCFKTIGCALVGVKIEVEGDIAQLDGIEPRILVSNHQASLDFLTMSAVFPRNCVVIAKRSLRFVPILGTYSMIARNILIDRKNYEKTMVTFKEAAKDIQKHKLSVFIYPEGTRSGLSGADMLPFKKGAFHLAQQAQASIVPIVFSSYDGVYNGERREFPGGVIRVKVLPAIKTTGMDPSHVEQLTKQTREKMLVAMQELKDRKDQ